MTFGWGTLCDSLTLIFDFSLPYSHNPLKLSSQPGSSSLTSFQSVPIHHPDSRAHSVQHQLWDQAESWLPCFHMVT